MHNNSEKTVLTLADSVKCKENAIPFGISQNMPNLGFKHEGRLNLVAFNCTIMNGPIIRALSVCYAVQ